MTTRTQSKAQSQPAAAPAPNGNGASNRTAVLTVYNDGTIIVAPDLTGGAALQIADMIRQAVLSAPIARTPQIAPELIPA